MSRPILKPGCTVELDSGAVRPWEIVPFQPLPQADAPAAVGGRSSEPLETPFATENRAEQILEAARAQAGRILQQAKAEAERIRSAARLEGLAEGRTTGGREWTARCDELAALIAQVGSAFAAFCTEQIPELASLAAASAEKLLHEQLALEPERVVAIVTHALEHTLGATRLTIHLNPEDLEIVRTHLAGNPGTSEGVGAVASRQLTAVELQEDPSVERGGCWIESEHGEVDATVSGRISRLSAVMGEA